MACYLFRVRKLMLALLFVALSISAFSQQPAAPPPSDAEIAARALRQYRDSQKDKLMDDFGELARYRDANAKLPPPKADEQRVVFFGDSITDFWDLAKYFPGKPYVDRGISGQTTPQMLVRFRQDVIDLKPKAVIIMAGTNDIAGNTGPESLDDLEANLQDMAELARAHGIAVVFCSVTPVHNYTPDGRRLSAQRPAEKILDLNRWLKNYSAENNIPYVDYFQALVDDQGKLKRELANDGLHPNAEGYALMAPLAERGIEAALKK